MNETEIKNLLRLLHSEDGQNALLAVSMLWGFEEFPKPLQLALGLVCYLERDEGIVGEAEELLQARLGVEGRIALTKSLLAFVKASSEYHMLLRHPDYAMMSEAQIVEAYHQQHEAYRDIISLHPNYVKLYLKTGIYWNYKSKTSSVETSVFFEDILQFEPNHPHALFGLAEHATRKMQDYGRAIGFYKQFAELYPQLHPNEAMMRDYQVVEYADLPTTFNAYQHLARIYSEKLDKHDKAMAHYQKAKDWIPNHPALDWHKMAELLWMYQGESELALQWVKEGLDIYTIKGIPKAYFFGFSPLEGKMKKAQLHELAGDLYLEEFGQLNDALRHYSDAIKEVPTLISARLKQIRLNFHQKKDYWQVEILCKKVFDYAPKNHEAKRYLNLSRKARGMSTTLK